MDNKHTSSETLDRLVLLLASRPRPGWENLFEEITRREVERLAPPTEQVKRPAAGRSGRGVEDGTTDKENSADATILH